MFVLATLLLAASSVSTQVPAQFIADRVYVVPTVLGGEHLRLYTDSGGGLFLKQSTVRRLHLPQRAMADGTSLVKLPAFEAGKGIPAPQGNDGWLMVAPSSMEEGQLPGLSHDDGLLGQAWFAGRVWTWDYPGKRLLLDGAGWRPDPDAQPVALGFKTGPDGKRETDFPRIGIKVNCRVLPMLLDTGAMTVLTPAAMQSLHDGKPGERATSMIVASIFDAWHAAHPDWRVIEDAQAGTHSAMIEVPWVEIAGRRVGPVWFTERPDKNFHQFMSSMMDSRVEGSIGGNALGHFVMTVDYPHATAYFRCTLACNAGSGREQ